MKIKGNYYIILAVVVGLVGVFAIHRVVSLKTQPTSEASQKVVVADADISSGTALNPRLVRTVDWPQRLIPQQAALSTTQVDGRVILAPLSKGEPILMSKLAPEGTAAGLGGLLSVEMRAFTIKVDDVSGVAGFIYPGDRVDVLMTLPMLDTKGEQLSKIILQDIKVLTAGPTWEQTPSTKQPSPVNTVTLEVSPEQSEVLNLASTQGKIRLLLRSRVNKAIKATNGVSTSHLINGYGSGHGNSSLIATDRPRKTVEVIRGVERSAATL